MEINGVKVANLAEIALWQIDGEEKERVLAALSHFTATPVSQWPAALAEPFRGRPELWLVKLTDVNRAFIQVEGDRAVEIDDVVTQRRLDAFAAHAWK